MPTPAQLRRQYSPIFPLVPLRYGLAALLGVLLPVFLGSCSPWRFALLLIALVSCRWAWGRCLAVAVLLAVFTSVRIDSAVAQYLESVPEPIAATVVGTVIAMQSSNPMVRRFEFLVGSVESADGRSLGGRRLQLSWYRAPSLTAAERWRLDVRLKPPSSLQNPGVFDFSRWLFANGLVATGSVRQGERLDNPARQPLSLVRAQLTQFLSNSPAGPLLRALVLGDSQALTSAHWQSLRRSGTVHLFVVSGLHVALVAGAGVGFGRIVMGVWGALKRREAGRWIAWASGALLSGCYLLLVGLGLPALRAWLMAAIASALYTSGRARRASAVLLWVLLALLFADPLAALLPGTWLSFTAVCSLQGYWQYQYARINPLAGLLRTQLLLSATLAPWLLWFSQPLVPLSPLANLVAVPVVTLLVLPLALVGSCLALLGVAAAEIPIELAGVMSLTLMQVLERVAEYPSWWPQLGHPVTAICLIVALLCALRPIGGWSLAVLGSLPLLLLLPVSGSLPMGVFKVTTLDVGQGSAVLVQTRRHNLLYDAGPAFPGGADLGQRVVVPAARHVAVATLEALAISHSDMDHAGGAVAVAAEFSPETYWSPSQAPGTRACQAGERWRWDGVWFEFVHPPLTSLGGIQGHGSNNDQSCVLHIRGAGASGNASALLTGDISAAAEARLLKGWYQPVNFLQVPHHGSASSSSAAFVRLLRPQVAVVSAARFGRYAHPHAKVVQRYQAVGARVVTTAEGGTVVWRSDLPGQLRRPGQGWSSYWRGTSAEG